MSVFRAKVIKQIDANKVATDFTKWCNNKSDCLYKSKKRKFHGWLNLTNLSKKNKVAQCGWDDGDCNHTTHYGIGGYHNVCPIGGFNGDLPWPAKLRFSDFDFKSNGITSTSKVKSITVHFEHRMIAIDTGTGTKYDNFGPTFHAKNGWGCKVYFTNGNAVVSKVQQYKGNPKLSKKDYSSINYKFNDITISELLKKNFALNIEYNHNHNTNPGIIYLKNVYIDVEYDSASIYLEGSANTNQLYLSKQEPCRTVLYHTIKAGYKNGDKIINPSAAPEKLGNKIQCLKKPSNVTVTKIKDSDSEKQFKIVDTSQKTGKKTIKYNLSNYPNKTVSLSYQAIQRPKPTYSFVPVYKSNEDFDSSKSYVIFKSGCASQIKIYIDSLNTTPLVLNVANQNSTTNLLDTTAIKAYHDRVKGLPCGPHVLYIQRGDETIQEARNNKVVITIRPMQFLFHIYEETTNTLSLQQSKNNRYQNIIIERIDNEPQKYIPQINVTDETNPTITTSYNNVAKGDAINYQIDKYYAGEYYISIQDTNPCNSSYKDKIIINSYHKQNYDYLFTRGEDGTAFDFDYLVAWEGDNIKEPLIVDSISLYHSLDDIRVCSKSMQAGLSEIGLIELKVKNKTNETINGIDIELNTLIEDENGNKVVTTNEWTEPDGIFNQFYSLFDEYNIALNKSVKVRNLTPDNDLVDEENVYLSIDTLEALDTITIYLPFRSTTEKTVYLQYLLFEMPMKIYNSDNCDAITSTNNLPTDIKIDVYDSMLTRLEINGNTDLLVLDPAYNCPNECYTTKDTDDKYVPINDYKSGGITYKITNIDTNDFDNQQSKTKIINSNELTPYGCIIDGEYYPLIDNNNDPIDIQNNKLQWHQETIPTITPMSGHNIMCSVDFPQSTEVQYTVRTNKGGIAEFFIPIPKSLNTSYTVEELLSNILTFSFKETVDYRSAILTKRTDISINDINDLNKNKVLMDYGNKYKRYKPGDTAYIPIFVSAEINTVQNYFIFNAQLRDIGQSDQVTILYQVCNLKDNEGIFKTIFKTDDKQLVPNQVSKNIYCGLDTNIDTNVKIDQRLVESTNLNVLYLDVYNQEKENQNVEIHINLGKDISDLAKEFLGTYNFIDINIETGDHAIIEDDDGNIHVHWLIGPMDSFEHQSAIIKIQAQDIGLSQIKVETFDYLHNENQNIAVKQSKCSKCQNTNTWHVMDSPWKQFDGVWYKLFDDGIYRRPVKVIIEDGKYKHEWVDKE